MEIYRSATCSMLSKVKGHYISETLTTFCPRVVSFEKRQHWDKKWWGCHFTIDTCQFSVLLLSTLLQTLIKTMAGRVSLSDDYQYNRIFIIGISDCTAEEIRDVFEQFGQITDVYIPRGRSSRENNRGVLIVSHTHSICFVLFH